MCGVWLIKQTKTTTSKIYRLNAAVVIRTRFISLTARTQAVAHCSLVSCRYHLCLFIFLFFFVGGGVLIKPRLRLPTITEPKKRKNTHTHTHTHTRNLLLSHDFRHVQTSVPIEFRQLRVILQNPHQVAEVQSNRVLDRTHADTPIHGGAHTPHK